MLILEVQHKTIFTKFNEVYKDCEILINGSPQLHPLFCLKANCPKNANCMNKLAHRIKYIFDNFKLADLLVLYFKYPDRPNSIRAGIFWRDMREPRLITMNQSAWEKLKSMGIVYEFNIPDHLFDKPTENKLISIRKT